MKNPSFEFAKAKLAGIPAALRGTIKRDYWDRYNSKVKQIHHPVFKKKVIREEGGEYDANSFMREASEHLGGIPCHMLDDEEGLREYAEQKAIKCRKIFGGWREADYKVRHSMALYGVTEDNPEKTTRFERIAAVEEYLQDEYIEPPKQDGDQFLRRVFCSSWWLKALRKSLTRRVEQAALCLGYVNGRKQIYCSDFAVERRRSQRHRLKAYANNLELVNEVGDKFSLTELIEKSNSNPAVRRAELMTRIRGMEEVADATDKAGVFLTVTAPSKYHPNSKNYNEASARDTQKYFNRIWSQVRAEWKRQNIQPFGLRVVEPHQDGCPHWHILLFVEPEKQKALVKTVRHYAMLEDGQERGAWKARLDVEFINKSKGSATAYIAKYISKNIDGYQLSGVKDKGEQLPISAAEAAERIDAWSALWGIRQFQFIGSAPVSVWRELRRIDSGVDVFDCIDNPQAEMCRQAADIGDWSTYTTRYFSSKIAGKELCLWKGEDWTQGTYGDLVPPKVKGIQCTGDYALTRYHTWEIVAGDKTASNVDAAFESERRFASERSEPWTRVNNCTKPPEILNHSGDSPPQNYH